MTQNTACSSNQVSSRKARTLLPDSSAGVAAVFAVVALLAATAGARAQAAAAQPEAASAQTTASQSATPQAGKKPARVRKQKAEKVVQSKDTRKADKQAKKVTPIVAQDAKLPDQDLYDKAVAAMKRGHYDVARLEFQDLLNTYQESQFLMKAKLGIADSWFQEGGTASLIQAEQEYTDFITFFPNAPEAAEAQMHIGDIYFRQMDKPDRDYSNTEKAEAAYRQMLQQFPDSTLVPEAKERLREVQEALAYREANVGTFYATRLNWSATIARYQTVVDTYPLYSQLDDVLIGLGDAFEALARGVRATQLPEAAKARLEKIDDDQAAAAYSEVVLEHSAAPHVEDAKDRLVAMGRPVPTPTPEQVAASEALENSRGQYTLSKRMELFVLSKADTVLAATTGDPPLTDATPVLAPSIEKQAMQDYMDAMNPATYATRSAKPSLAASVPAAAPEDSASGNTTGSAAPLALGDVSTANTAGTGASTAAISVMDTTPATASSGNSVGIEIVQPSAGSPAVSSGSGSPPVFPGSDSTGTAQTAPASDTSQPNSNGAQPGGIGGLQAGGAPGTTVLAPIEKAAEAPDPVNEAAGGAQPPSQLAPVGGKKAAPALDKSDESSSKHKKKGLGKLNPF